MYAIIQTGGKQYRATPGEIIETEKLEGELGSKVEFSEVLFASKPGESASDTWIGHPFLDKGKVVGEIVGQGRGDKILIMKFKRRKNYHRKQGHRQDLTHILVTEVDNGSGAKASLTDTDRTAVLDKFTSPLKAKGLPRTPKTLGSRKRMAANADSKAKTAKKSATKKPAADKPAPKKAAKKTASKK